MDCRCTGRAGMNFLSPVRCRHFVSPPAGSLLQFPCPGMWVNCIQKKKRETQTVLGLVSFDRISVRDPSLSFLIDKNWLLGKLHLFLVHILFSIFFLFNCHLFRHIQLNLPVHDSAVRLSASVSYAPVALWSPP